jgi:hypothetical protein
VSSNHIIIRATVPLNGKKQQLHKQAAKKRSRCEDPTLVLLKARKLTATGEEQNNGRVL